MAANAAVVLHDMHQHVKGDLHAMDYARQTEQFGFDYVEKIAYHLRELDSLYKIVAVNLEKRGITATMGKTYEETHNL